MLIGLLIEVLIVALICGLVLFLFRSIPVLAPFAWLANVIVVVVLVIWLITVLAGLHGGVVWR